MKRDELEEEIKKQIKEIEANIDGLKEGAKPVALDTSIGRLSRMDAMGTQAVNKKTYESAKMRLDTLKRALTNIHSDTFGLCAECEEEIDPKRLLAMPESLLCIECAKK